MSSNRFENFTAQLLPRLQELRVNAQAPAPRETLASELIEELQTAIEELRVTEEQLLSQQGQLEDAWLAAETASDWNRALFDGAADAMLLTDPDGLVRDANLAAAALLGVPGRSVRGKPLAVYVPTDERTEFRARLRALVHEPLPARFDLCLQPRLAVPVMVEASVARFAPPGAAPGLHWTLRDVTAARQADEGERDAARGYLRALGALPHAAVVLDVDGRVALWNAAVERLLGWSEDEAAGLRAPCWGEAAERAVEAALEAADEGEAARVTVAARTRDGHDLPLEVCAARLTDEAGDPRGTVLTLAPAQADAPVQTAARPAWTEAEMRRVLLAGGGAVDLAERMRTGIAAGLFLGHLHPGDRLPSIREVARHTGEDHRAVSAAYRRLAAEGVVEVRNRHGVLVGAGPEAPEMPASETAEWLAEVIGQAAALQVKVTQLPELVRRWTGEVPVRCLCVDGTEDGLAALCGELHAQWGFDTHRFLAGGPESSRRDALAAAVRDANVVVTTPFHAHAVDAAARASGTPVVVLDADPELVAAAEARLRTGPLTAVVADARHGERLRGLTGGERLRIVLADDAEAVAALDPAEPVLMTRAAQQRVGRPLRLLAPVSPAFSASRARELAAVLIQRNLRAHRTVV
ncbi:MAG TPA: PAS domain-containing protein [Longimicrobium sp.]|nr:PAS domain-containing protein [Longimicrobium sp.]